MQIKTNQKQELIDITSEVKKFVKESKIKDSALLIYVPHTTAAIAINENAGIEEDIIKALNKIVPEHDNYEHDKKDNNAAAHIKSSLIGNSKIIPVKSGELQLGTWQYIFFCEFDGPRNRTVILKIID